ncbi:hypothetical protein DVR12_24055 [Chitinophaga silvatica]|uniref:Transposase n=1 Tax=Chitinophaga silvatica TaxID=2282649 RepID=A0A3E1Y3N7_9BACT|nr:hypothetical protein [Chitinophaga silvatica]RFS19310.1 hypothetical protein DVR12_24055 [Chitinophaga silvatica]
MYGAAGLTNTKERKKAMGKQPKKNITPLPTASLEDKFAALQRENEYLRAENALLKKLEALIQEEEAAKKQGKSQKPSTN